jgi:hypothetical protein
MPSVKPPLVLCLCALTLAACGTITPTVTSTSTQTSTPVESPTQTGTPAPTNTATPRIVPTRDPSITPVAVIPCLLITGVEASAALGAPVGDPNPTQGGCLFFDSDAGQYALSYFVLPAEYSAQAISGHVLLLNTFGAQITPTQTEELQQMGTIGDMLGVIEGLAEPLVNLTEITSAREDLGDDALWASRQYSYVRQGMLLVARGDALIGIDLVVTSGRDEASLRASALSMATQLLERLPEHFTLLGSVTSPTPALPTEPVEVPTPITSPSASPGPGTTVPASPTPQPPVIPTTAVAVAATLKPPAFSAPVLAGDTISYGGTCGTNLQTVTVKVIDASGISPITTVSIAVRLVGQGGQVTDWKALPMRAEGSNVWLRTLIVEQDLPGYEQFTTAAVEYYFLATNSSNVSAESLHFGLNEVPLRLVQCPQDTPTASVTTTP